MATKQSAAPRKATADVKAPPPQKVPKKNNEALTSGLPRTEEEELPKFTGKFPKTLAGCADRLYTVRQERLALERQAKELRSEEFALREKLINELPKGEASGIGGKVCFAYIESKPRFVPEGGGAGWPKIWKYIEKEAPKNPGVWALLRRQLNEGTVKEVFASGKKIPGIVREEVKYVSLNKR